MGQRQGNNASRFELPGFPRIDAKDYFASSSGNRQCRFSPELPTTLVPFCWFCQITGTRDMTRWWLTLGLLIAMALLMGCNPGSGGKNTLRFGLATSPLTLDPRYATDVTSTRIIRLLYQPPVDLDASGKLISIS